MKAIASFQGNAQGQDRDTGMDRLHWSVLRKLAGPELTVYHPRTWRASTKPLLEQWARHKIRHVALIGYSHGQAPVMEIARNAWEYGVDTINIWLCDPVWRNPCLPRWRVAQALSVRSLFSGMKIRVPDTVSRVEWCRQKVDLPKGHDLVADDKTATHIATPLWVDAKHTQIQWHQDWFSLVESGIDWWLNPRKPRIIQPNDL
jgi:hypothetical protein